MSGAVLAQTSDEPDPIKWTAKAQPAASANNQFTVQLRATIDRGWHLYSTEKVEGGPSPTRISISPGQNMELAGEIDSPAPHSAFDPNFQVSTEFYDGETAFTVPIKSSGGATANDKVRLQVRYQTCSPTICLPPKLIEVEAPLNGAEAKTAAAAKSPEQKLPVNGAATADFAFVDFEGQVRRFSEFRGRVVLLDFWASWCSPCLADIPQLKAVYQKFHAQGFEIIGMDSETLGQPDIDAEFAKDAQLKAREIVKTRGVTWPQATPHSSLPIAGSFGIENLPGKILVDKSGKVVGRVKNVSELDALLPGLLNSQN
ncbi:MAG TPA: protein-disulfide reductase DsbD domain-containing protein [Pyrinomonadaceae bacterium]|nr:protein-disulfide reductase DsbD domain-containing protein [Pyrinomonadaceae bacterium]